MSNLFFCAVFIACPDCVTAKTKNAYQFFFFFFFKRYRIIVCFVLILHFFSPQYRTWKTTTTTTTTTQLTTTEPIEAVKKGATEQRWPYPPVTIQVLRKVSSFQKSNQVKPCIARLLIRMNIIHVGCSSISAVLLRRRPGEGKKSEGTLP